jgi:hypothetical protein
MLSPPRILLTVGASFLTANTARKLRGGRDAVPAQGRAFANLRGQLALTAYGRITGIEPTTTYQQFQERVPLQNYEGFLPYIERMKKGEADVLWPGHCNFYAVSAGTTGKSKHLPVTAAMLEHFNKAGRDSLLYYTARVGHTGVFRGKHLFLGGCTMLSQLEESKELPIYAGDLSGITALNLPGWVEKHIYEPGPEVAHISDWAARIHAITERTWDRDVTLLAGIPSWVLILAEALKARASSDTLRPAHLQQVWPNLECFVHGGVPIGPYVDELRMHIGPKVNFHEVYPASEGFIATQDSESAYGLRLMTDVGLFFEFLPMRSYQEDNLAQLGHLTVPLEGVQAGVDYALVLSTPAGLTRYVVGDVVRFLSTDIPRLIYIGRTALQLNGFGEHVVEKELTDAIVAVCQRHGWLLVNFHVAPLFSDGIAGIRRGRHEWWVELKPFTAETPTGPVIAAELDVELKRLNEDYAGKRKSGTIEPPHVKLVMPGIFEHWLRIRDKWGGKNKMPRCRSDRVIADELAQVARFSAEA